MPCRPFHVKTWSLFPGSSKPNKLASHGGVFFFARSSMCVLIAAGYVTFSQLIIALTHRWVARSALGLRTVLYGSFFFCPSNDYVTTAFGEMKIILFWFLIVPGFPAPGTSRSAESPGWARLVYLFAIWHRVKSSRRVWNGQILEPRIGGIEEHCLGPAPCKASWRWRQKLSLAWWELQKGSFLCSDIKMHGEIFSGRVSGTT